MHSERATVAFAKDREVATRFSGLDDAKRVFLTGHGNVRGVVARDLEEDAGIRSPLVGLPGRVQETRAEPQARGDACASAYGKTHRLQRVLVLVGHPRVPGHPK